MTISVNKVYNYLNAIALQFPILNKFHTVINTNTLLE